MASKVEGKTITMKLLIDTNKRTVLFAEAEKECVDFLFHILSLPLGTVVNYLDKDSMSGSVGNLYGSLERLSPTYLQQGLNKDCLLKPKPASGMASGVPLLATSPAAPPAATTFYTCPKISTSYSTFSAASCPLNVSDGPGAFCPNCRGRMDRAVSFVASPAKAQSIVGYVKGVVSYMITDDLCVQPISMVSGIAMLNKFNVQSVQGLEEREVTLDINLGLTLLKASLMSTTVLTDVFLAMKGVDMK